MFYDTIFPNIDKVDFMFDQKLLKGTYRYHNL